SHERGDHAPGDMEDAQAMRSTRMRGPGIDQVGRAELADPIELLELFEPQDAQERPRHVNVLPDRVTNRLGVVVFKMVEDALFFAHCGAPYSTRGDAAV